MQFSPVILMRGRIDALDSYLKKLNSFIKVPPHPTYFGSDNDEQELSSFSACAVIATDSSLIRNRFPQLGEREIKR